MIKELEALSQIEKHVNCYKKDKEDYKEHFETLHKALTPPTAEEVCKALEKYVDYGEVKYINKCFYACKYKIRYSISKYADKNQYQICAYLPPHLITLIGRFYESVVE